MGLRIAQHLFVDRLDHEPAAQPFQVEAREVLAPARREIDDANSRRSIHFDGHCVAGGARQSRDRWAIAAVAASRSLASKGTTSSAATVPGSTHREDSCREVVLTTG